MSEQKVTVGEVLLDHSHPQTEQPAETQHSAILHEQLDRRALDQEHPAAVKLKLRVLPAGVSLLTESLSAFGTAFAQSMLGKKLRKKFREKRAEKVLEVSSLYKRVARVLEDLPEEVRYVLTAADRDQNDTLRRSTSTTQAAQLFRQVHALLGKDRRAEEIPNVLQQLLSDRDREFAELGGARRVQLLLRVQGVIKRHTNMDLRLTEIPDTLTNLLEHSKKVDAVFGEIQTLLAPHNQGNLDWVGTLQRLLEEREQLKAQISAAAAVTPSNTSPTQLLLTIPETPARPSQQMRILFNDLFTYEEVQAAGGVTHWAVKGQQALFLLLANKMRVALLMSPLLEQTPPVMEVYARWSAEEIEKNWPSDIGF